jgi:hypothetical protein
MKENINSTLKRVGPLTTTQWDQGYPYNYQYPSNYAMGCAGIALAQILRFHPFPMTGRGVIPGEEGGRPPLDIDGYVYDWDNIPRDAAIPESEAEKQATSMFINHAALVCGSRPSTGGVLGDVATHLAELRENFRCDINVVYVDADDATLSYSVAETERILREQLEQGCPAYYGIPKMVHAVVCDGYDDKGKFSFNFGWGSEQFWYPLAKLPGSPVINIRPELAEALFCPAMSLSATPEYTGESAEVTLQISNNNTESFSAEMRIVATDLPGVVRNVLSETVTVGVDAGACELKTFTIQLPAETTFGQRFIQAEYRGEDGFFRPFRDSDLNLVRAPFLPVRQMSAYCSLATALEVPAIIATNQTLTLSASVNFQGAENTEKYLSAVLVDAFYSTRFVLGTSKVTLTVAEPNNVNILCSFSEVVSETDYLLALIESDTPEPVFNQDSLLGSSTYPCAYPLHVKGDNFALSDEFVLVRAPEIPEPVYDSSHWSLSFDLQLIKAVDQTRFIGIYMTDVNGDFVNFFRSPELPGVTPGIRTYTVSFDTPGARAETIYTFSIVEARIISGEAVYHTVPLKDSLVPAEISRVVEPRNFYDFMYLSSSVELSAGATSIGESFTVSGAVIFSPQNSVIGATIIDLCAMAQDSAGYIREVGRGQTILLEANLSQSFSIDCAFDETFAKASYQIFIRATECGNYDGPERDKMYGLNEDIVIMRDILLK